MSLTQQIWRSGQPVEGQHEYRLQQTERFATSTTLNRGLQGLRQLAPLRTIDSV
jgi:hypothetical protein